MLGEAFAALQHPQPLPIIVLFLGVVANLVLSGFVFSLLMSRYGRVGVLEMQALIATASLLNYLPLRPGLLGRLAYHRTVNDIPITKSARAVLEAIAISAVIVAYLAASLVTMSSVGGSIWLCVVVPVPLLAIVSLWRPLRIWCLAGLCRYLEVLVWAVRYHCAFLILGAPVDAEVSITIACVSVIATMVPFVSNGLGVREWAVGGAARLVSTRSLEYGLSAELVNRVAELLVVVAAGLLGAAYLSRCRSSRAEG
jgi:hypothetical protein